jgi:hypothetical protein
MTRNCIWMGVFSHVVTLPLLTAHSSASRVPRLRFWIQRPDAERLRCLTTAVLAG